MSDASIPLGFKPAQIQEPDIVGGIQRGLNLQQMAQATQLNQSRIQEEQLKAQALEEDRRDNQTIQQEYAKNPGDVVKVRQAIASQVNPRNLQAFDKSVQEHAAALAKMHIDDITVQRETAEQLARHLDAVGAVKSGDNSPEATAARAAEWAKQVTLAKSKGLDPTNQLTTQYPGDQALPVYDMQLRGSAKHLADEEARRKAEETALTIQQKKHEVEADARTEASGILAAAAQRGAGDYIAARAAIEKKNPALAGVFPDVPEDAQPVGALADEFVQNVQNVGMKPHEQAATALSRQQRETAATAAESNAAYKEAMANVASDRAGTYAALADVRSRLADIAEERVKNGGQTQNSKAVDQRTARREYDKLRIEENKLNRLRGVLGPLVSKEAAGEALVNQTGANKGEKRNVREEFDQATDELEGVLRDKYDAAARAGMGAPSVSVDDAIKAIRKGATPSTPAATPSPAPAAAPPAAKPATAPASKATLDDAVKAIEKSGKKLSADKVTVLSDGTGVALVNGQPTRMQKNGNNWEPSNVK